MPGIAGRFFDGVTAGDHRVDVVLDEAGGRLVFDGPTFDDGPVFWQLGRLRALRDQARDASLTLTLHADSDDEAPRDAARLTISEPGTIARLQTICPDLHKRDVHKGLYRKLAARGAMAVAAVVLMLFVILPRMADTLATLIPVEREIALGKTVVAQMEQALGAADMGALNCQNPQGRAALTVMLDRLTDRQNLQYELEVQVFDHEMVNAFAAPGGQVVVLRGLLDNASGPDAVAAVLAHEIGHVEERDATRHALRAAGSAGLLSMVLGDVTGGAIAVFLGERLLQAGYTREAETRADRFALNMLNAAEVDSAGMARFFDHLQALDGDMPQLPEYFATHPASEARADRARANANRQGATAPVLTDAQWQALQGICG